MADVEEVRKRLGAVEGTTYKSSSIKVFSMSIDGIEGVGKSHFPLMTMPTPIVHVNLGDRKADLFLDRMTKERRDQVTLYNFVPKSPEGWSIEEGKRSLSALKEISLAEAGEGRLAGGTFVLDSGSSYWEVIQEVYIAPEEAKREAAGDKKIGGLIYGKGNMIVNGYVNWLKAQGCFVVITHRKRQDWDAKGPIPFRFSAQTNKKIPYLVEVRLDLYKTCEVCDSEWCEARTHQGRKHYGQLLKFAGNDALEGMAMENPTFELIYSLYTGQEFPEPERLPSE